jgi:hypothetical protein
MAREIRGPLNDTGREEGGIDPGIRAEVKRTAPGEGEKETEHARRSSFCEHFKDRQKVDRAENPMRLLIDTGTFRRSFAIIHGTGRGDLG